VDRYVLSVRTATDETHYPISNAPELDGRASGLDLACEFHSGNVTGRSWRRWILALALQDVGTI
jgi:hypothetical protein